MRFPRIGLGGAQAGPGLGFPQNVLVGLGGLVFAYVSAKAIVTVASAGYLSVGLLVGNLAVPISLFGLLAVLLAAPSIGGLVPSLPSRRSLFWGIVPALLGTPVVFAFAVLLSGISLTHTLVTILAAGGAAVALILAFLRSGALGMTVLLVTLPFVSFLESRGGGLMLWSGPFAGPFVASSTLVLLWSLTLATLLGSLIRKEWPGWPRVGWVLLAFSVLLFLSAAASENPLRSFRDVNLDVFGGLLFFFLAWFSIHSQRDVLLLVVGLVVFGVLRMAIVYYFFTQHAELGSLVAQGNVSRQTVVHPGIVGWVGLFTLTLGMGLLAMQRKQVLSWVLAVVVTWTLLAILLTGIRSAVVPIALTMPVALLFLLPRLRKGTRIALVAIGVGLGAYTFLFTPDVLDRFGEWGSIDSFAQEQGIRLDFWQAAFRMSLDYPFLGVGPGMAGEYYPLYARHVFFIGPGRFPMNTPHNVALHYASQSGLPAAVLLGLILTLGTREAFRLLRRLSAGPLTHLQPLALGLSWALLAAVVSGLLGGTSFANGTLLWSGPSTHFYFVSPEPGFLFWFVLGLLFSLRRVALETGESASDPRPQKNSPR